MIGQACRSRVRGTGTVIGATAVAWFLATLFVLTFAHPVFDPTVPVPVARAGAGTIGLLSKDAGAPPMAERRGPAQAVIVSAPRERGGSASKSSPDTPQVESGGVPFPADVLPQLGARGADRHLPSHAPNGFEARAPPTRT